MISDQNNHVFMAVFFYQWSFIIIFIPGFLWKQREDQDDGNPEGASEEGEDYVIHKKRWR